MGISPESMCSDIASIAAQQKDIDYESTFIEGADDSEKYMKGLFDDWQVKGITSVLHEKRGGYANNRQSMLGLAAKEEAEGVKIQSGVTVTGFISASGSDAISAVETAQGTIECDYVIISVGSWVKIIWDMLSLPKTISIKDADGKVHDDMNMWIYRSLQEGTLGVDPSYLKTNDGKTPPVIHVDSDAPYIPMWIKR